MSVAVLSPHLDDAVLSCWHLLAGDEDVLVVNVFTAAPDEDARPGAWWDVLTGATDARARMRERLAEDAEALGLAGRTPLNLGFLDEQYRSSEVPAAAVAERVVSAVDADARIVAPACLGAVPDHDVVLAAALLLEQRGYEIALYADLPHAIRFGWPASVTGVAPDPPLDVDAYWNAVLARSVPPGRALRSDVHALDDDAHAAKLDAIGRYRTQLPALLALNPRLVQPATLRHEATWRRG